MPHLISCVALGKLPQLSGPVLSPANGGGGHVTPSMWWPCPAPGYHSSRTVGQVAATRELGLCALFSVHRVWCLYGHRVLPGHSPLGASASSDVKGPVNCRPWGPLAPPTLSTWPWPWREPRGASRGHRLCPRKTGACAVTHSLTQPCVPLFFFFLIKTATRKLPQPTRERTQDGQSFLQKNIFSFFVCF